VCARKPRNAAADKGGCGGQGDRGLAECDRSPVI
jgi:hypothetical protein